MNIRSVAPIRQFLFFAPPIFLCFIVGVFLALPMVGWITAWILLLIFSIGNNFFAFFAEKFALYIFSSLFFLTIFLGGIYGIAFALPSSDLLLSSAFWNMFFGLIIVHFSLLLLAALLRQWLINRYSRK
jgi:hypothetical protein